LEMLVELLGRWTGDRKNTSALEEELLSIQTGMRRLFDSIFVN